MSQWQPVIGLEIHAQLNTASKLFSGASTAHGAEPNTQASAVDVALPGTLPVLNRAVVEKAIRLGVALNATIAPKSIFARKNYFYPDLPKGYQISQFELPIVSSGTLHVRLDDGRTLAAVRRGAPGADATALVRRGRTVHRRPCRSRTSRWW